MEASFITQELARATDNWTSVCERLVPKILCQRDWLLIAQDELPVFVKRVEQSILDGTVGRQPGALLEDTVRRATIHAYCFVMYEASGENGTLRQRRAFEEIMRHVQGVAFRYEQNPEVIQTCVQNALEIVWEKRDHVREPGSFLRYIEKVVYYEIKGYWKGKHRRQEVPVSRMVPTGENDDSEERVQHLWETLASIPPADDEIVNRQVREQLWNEVKRVLAGNERYQAIIIGYYLYERSLPALAETLQTSVRNVYVLKSRALARLRADAEFVRQFADALETLPGGSYEPSS